MKSLNEFISESRAKTLSLKEYEALMLRDFLRDADFSNFGTKEDKECLENILNKLEKMEL